MGDPTWLILFFTVAYNLTFCAVGICIFKDIRLKKYMVFILFCIAYPMFTGLYNDNTNQTYLMDCAIYTTLALKLVLFNEYFKLDWFREKVDKFLLKYALIGAIVCLASSVALVTLTVLGFHFYYSLTPDITFGFAHSIVYGNMMKTFLFLMAGFLSGKRMLIVGLLVIAALAYKKYIASIKTLTMILLVLVGFIYLVENEYAFAPLSKLTIFSKYDIDKSNLGNTISTVDRHRYDEFMSITSSMDSADFLFGKGYGFRYQLFDEQFGYVLDDTITNSHFTPIGIISKFGVIGLIIFYTLFIMATIKAFHYRKKSKQLYVVFLCLFSYLVQANFAYILFQTPVFALLLSYSLSYRPEQRRDEAGANVALAPS